MLLSLHSIGSSTKGAASKSSTWRSLKEAGKDLGSLGFDKEDIGLSTRICLPIRYV